MRRSSLASVLIVLAFVLAITAPAANAGGHFTKPRVTYRDKSTFRSAVSDAVRMWNAAGTPVKLIKARRGKTAQITITTKPKLVGKGGRVVAGQGGGKDFGKRRVYGFVWLSKLLDAQPESVRVNVAAHELGHALGLGHDRNPCTLMSEFADDVIQSVCPAGPGLYRCGPQAGDAAALAKLYRGRARFPVGAGTCALPAPQFELLVAPEVSVPSGGMVEATLRNSGTTAWKAQPFALTFVDSSGERTGAPCAGGVPMSATMNEDEVPPGGVATFALMVCGQPGETLQLAVRVVDEASDPGRPYLVGPPAPITVHII